MCATPRATATRLGRAWPTSLAAFLLLASAAARAKPALPAPSGSVTVEAPAEPAKITATSEENHFVARDGTRRNADQVYEDLHDTGDARPVRAALEMGIMLGGGTAWYWATKESNARDWDATDIAGRLNGRDWRIDNNGLDVNFMFHALSGTAYYGIARANHLSVPVAYGYSFGSSFLWDFALEYNERISISDVLVTPSAGLLVGEYLHRVSWYLNGVPRRPTTRHHVLRWSPIGASVAIHRAWDGADDPIPFEVDPLGYDADLWHRFEFEYGLSDAESPAHDSTVVHSVRHRGELHAVPGFLRPGRQSRFFSRADFSFMDVEATFSERGAGVDLRAEAMLLGWFAQSFRDEQRGQALVLGLNMAHRYLNTVETGTHEFYAALHLPGPGADLWAREGLLGLRLSGRAQFDFAGVGSPAYPEWREDNPRVRTKNVLSKQSYYIGWGYSTRLAGALSLGPAELSWRSMVGWYDSQEGLDRAQDEVQVDLDGKDLITEWTLGAAVDVVDVERAGWGLSLGGELSERDWHSRAGEYRAHTRTRSAGGVASVVF
jgi:hypothetical protein